VLCKAVLVPVIQGTLIITCVCPPKARSERTARSRGDRPRIGKHTVVRGSPERLLKNVLDAPGVSRGRRPAFC
jgi:hypothetical protein